MKECIGVIGAGAMGSGIAQVAAVNLHEVFIFERDHTAVTNSKRIIGDQLGKLVRKNKMSDSDREAVLERMNYAEDLDQFASCQLIFEAIIEDLGSKKSLFSKVEEVANRDAILATNTSSLSVTGISAACRQPGRMLGIHFFNPAPVMPLVEIIPTDSTENEILNKSKTLIKSWGKTVVIAKDTPGFIVNRIARPFYGEALRILEEGIADAATIDQAMRDEGFRMGPFELMDYIGIDVNFAVTESVFRDFFFDPRYKPSFTQKKMVESGRLGRKSGKGFYDYSEGAPQPVASEDAALKKTVSSRILAMLINEAVDAFYLGIASGDDIETAMTRGVNYPKGLLAWCDEIGISNVLKRMHQLFEDYGEDRYRPSILMKRMAEKNSKFF